MPRESQQGNHGAAASPGGRRVGAHPHALGQADVNGKQGVHCYSFEGRVQLHAVFLWHFGGLSSVPAASVGRFFTLLTCLVLDLTQSPWAASALSGGPAATEGLMVEGHKLRSAQDAVSLPRPGSHTGGHTGGVGAKFSSVAIITDCQSPEDNASGARQWNVPG